MADQYKEQAVILSYDISLARRLKQKLRTVAQVEIVGSPSSPIRLYEDIRVIVYDPRVKELVHKHLKVELEWTSVIE